MLRQRQPRSLRELCISDIAQRIISQSESMFNESGGGTMPPNLEVMRQAYVASLCGTVRTQLLEHVNWLLFSPPWPPTPMETPPRKLDMLYNYASCMLLNPDIESFCLRICCNNDCCHLETIFALLAQQGSGLRSLKVSWSTSSNLNPVLLQQALMQPVSLKCLYIPHICCDEYLQVISSCCPNLSFLDVSMSDSVTDNGLMLLFLKKNVPIQEGISSTTDTSLCLDPQCGNSDCQLMQLLFKFFQDMLCSGECGEGAGRLNRALDYWKCETELCSSLNELDIYETSVTPRGALLALMKAHALHSLGGYLNLGSAMEMFLSSWRDVYQGTSVNLPTFDLKSVQMEYATEPQLDVVKEFFPSLMDMCLFDPELNPPALTSLPLTVNTLRLNHMQCDGLWIAALRMSLDNPLGKNLLFLSLDFSETQEINLYNIFQSCPNLRTFTGDCMQVQWVEGASQSNVSMPNLRYLKLANVVDYLAVVKALKGSPNLEVAHFYECRNLTDEDIIEVTHHLSKKLKCFYIYEALNLTHRTVSIVQAASENLSCIGDIRHWSFQTEDLLRINTASVKKWYIDLSDTGHWYASNCKT